MAHILSDFKAFLDESPTSWHAVSQLGNRFAIRDFIPLKEGEKWNLEPEKRYFVIQGGTLCAFSLPQKKPLQAILLASHTDSPALKLKPEAVFQKENMHLLGVETYGSPLLTSWLNRDLSLAGKVIVLNSQDEVEEKLVFIDDALLFIPQLAIHLDQDVNKTGLVLNKQDHLCPIIGLSDASSDTRFSLEALLRRHLVFNSLISFELFLVPVEQARFMGAENEMIASYRLDNLASAHATATAMAMQSSVSEQTLQMAFFYDHEEIGSQSSKGAGSPFLNETLSRICYALDLNVEELLLLKHRSLCVSIDMAHALNPNYPDKHDSQHAPLLGKGIAIKYNANQKYATSAFSAAAIILACKQLNLPYQSFASRSDLPCGSTIGPIIAESSGIATVDIGAPQLSMHSVREVMACQDHMDMCRLLSHLVKEY